MSEEPIDREERGEDVLALRSARVFGAPIPSEVLLAPWGRVESTQGDFVVDEESARLVASAFVAHGTDVPIDYEHQTLGGRYAAPDGQAPAAGWIKGIDARPREGLFGRIEWTDRARRQVLAKEYRYISPVALVRKRDRKLIALHSAALTNKPAIVGMRAIVNRSTDDDAKTPLMVLREELALDADAPVEDVLAAAGQRLRALEDAMRGRHARERVAQAVRAGQLVEAQMRWAEELVLRDEACFDEFVRTAPAVVSYGRTTPPDAGSADGTRAVAARARAEYRAHPLIGRLTSEEAYVDDALRAAS